MGKSYLNSNLIRIILIWTLLISTSTFAKHPEEYYAHKDGNEYLLSANFIASPEDVKSYDLLPENVRSFIHNERFLNDRINHADFESIEPTTVPALFLPESGAIFKVWSVDIPIEDLNIYFSENVDVSKLPRQFIKSENGKTYIKFIIHPVSYFYYKDVLKDYDWKLEYLAVSTSSYRSLIIWKRESPQDPHYVKLSLDLNIGGFTRLIHEEDLRKATSNTSILNSIGRKNKQELKFENLPELISYAPKGVKGGMIIRDIEPIKNHFLVPMFSLYSQKFKSSLAISDKHTLLGAIIADNQIPAKQIVSKEIIEPLVDMALYFYFRLGLTSHLHEQNVLFDVESKNGFKYWIRDNEQFYMDVKGYLQYLATQSKDYSFASRSHISNIIIYKKTENPFDEITSYIRDSNLFALQQGLSKDYPEITSKWISNEFERILIEKSRKYISGNYKTLIGLKRSYKKEMKKWDSMVNVITDLSKEIGEDSCSALF